MCIFRSLKILYPEIFHFCACVLCLKLPGEFNYFVKKHFRLSDLHCQTEGKWQKLQIWPKIWNFCPSKQSTFLARGKCLLTQSSWNKFMSLEKQYISKRASLLFCYILQRGFLEGCFQRVLRKRELIEFGHQIKFRYGRMYTKEICSIWKSNSLSTVHSVEILREFVLID